MTDKKFYSISNEVKGEAKAYDYYTYKNLKTHLYRSIIIGYVSLFFIIILLLSIKTAIFRFGDVEVNASSRVVTKGGSPVSLSLKEFDLLAFLCRNMGMAIEKEKIVSEVWGAFSEVDASTLTVHIRWLREKLEEDPSKPQYIKTVFKVGYILEA